MRFHACVVLAFVLGLGFASSAAADSPSHVVGRTEMQAAVTARVTAENAQRAQIQTLLQRPEVRRVADRSGLDLDRAQAAAANLDGEALDRVAAQATIANAQLEGGLVIYATTLIIILLVVILLLLV